MSEAGSLPRTESASSQGPFFDPSVRRDHHITEIPKSLSNCKKRTLRDVEEELHNRIDQLTQMDTHRFHSVLRLFQVNCPSEYFDDQKVYLRKKDFHHSLSRLGVFANKKEAEYLFDKYDVNGDGELTVHEFMNRARRPDYPLGLQGTWNGKVNEREPDLRRGVKMYTYNIAKGAPVRPRTPKENIYELKLKKVYKDVADKMAMNARTGTAFSDATGRRTLIRVFKNYDGRRCGKCDTNGVKRALDEINYSIGSSHLAALQAAHKSADGAGFDYVSFAQAVFPENKSRVATSIHLGTEYADAYIKRMEDQMAALGRPFSAATLAYGKSRAVTPM